MDETERMDEEHEGLVVDLMKKLIQFLHENVGQSEKYSRPNICINALTAAIFTIFYTYAGGEIDKDLEDKFIKNMQDAFRRNFEANRRVQE